MLKHKLGYIKTAISFTANLKTTGALFQTSVRAENEVSKNIFTDKKQIILEFGAGHGNITKAILRKMHKDSVLYSFEINSDFCKVLSQIKDKRLVIVNDTAQNFDHHLSFQVDRIISSIPLTLIEKPIVLSILQKSQDRLKQGGCMSQIVYSTFHLNKFREYFKSVNYKFILGFPIEFVYHSEK